MLRDSSERREAALQILAATTGLVLFALTAHQPGGWRALGLSALLLPVWAMLASARRPHASTAATRRRWIATTLLGIGLGIAAGIWHRTSLGLSAWSLDAVAPFVVVACGIGITEELVYRGWLFGRARLFGAPAAILIAAAAHAAYKTALFAWPTGGPPVDLIDLAVWTAAGGLALGGLRAVSASVVPAAAAHAAFDLVVYAAVTDAPWWVWG